MSRRNHDESVFDNGEEPVAIGDVDVDVDDDDDDDDEANEDLSLKILEKALSRRGLDSSKESSLSDLRGSGVVSTVMANGGKSKGIKKMKRTKREAAQEISLGEDSVEDGFRGKEEDDDGDEVEISTEPKPGETSSNNMVLKKLLRGARYFDPPDAGWVTCYSCGEQGHITVNCPTPTKRRKPCFICGSLEHGAKQCSKGQDCYICKKGGHRAKDCPDKYKSAFKKAVCLRCGDFGHDMILCKYEYSLDDLKDIQCYVCKSFGHLCCVEPGNSPSWAVSCYRCGHIGHTGLACGRHFDESSEKDPAVPSSCFKCGREGHSKRDCPNSSSLSSLGNSREVPSVCYRCGEEGHFSRECPNASSIGCTSQGSRDSPSLCYKCNGAGHFARECPNTSQGSKRTHDLSTPSSKSRKKSKKDSEHTSTPSESNGKMKKKKKRTQKGEQPQTTPRKPKHRGGWITEDPEEEYFQRGNIRRPRSPITPSSHRGHDYRSAPTITYGGHFRDSRATTRYGRNHTSFESSAHHLGHQEPYYHHHHQQQPHYYHNCHDNHHEDRRYAYAPAPSRYGPAYHYGDANNFDRY